MADTRRAFLGAATFEAGRGGIARVARTTATALAAIGCQVELLGLIDEQGQSVGPLRSSGAGGSKLRFVVSTVLANLRATHCVYDATGLARAHPSLGPFSRPYAVWLHGIEVWRDLSPSHLRAIRGAKLCLANSSYTLKRFEAKHGPLPQGRVCMLGTEDDSVPEMANSDGPPTALILGRIDAEESYKGHVELIEAWPAVCRAVPNARLAIAGGGSGLGAIRQLAAASPAAGNIDVLGFVPEGEIEGLWRRATVFAMPSRGEGFGLVYVEAMRFGLPVVASVHDAGQEVNEDGVSGFNANLDTPGHLTSIMTRLLRERDMARKMGAAGRARWQSQFRGGQFLDRVKAAMTEFLK